MPMLRQSNRVWRRMALTCGLLWIAGPARARGQSTLPEYQFRVLGHVQRLQGAHMGVAAWTVFPNVAHRVPMRTLLLVGAVYKAQRRWTEVMAGELLSSADKPGFELDLRHLEHGAKWVSAFIEIEYNFRSRRLLLNPIATVPLLTGRAHWRAGFESDLVVAPTGRFVVIGPRLVTPVPLCAAICRDIVLTTAYRLQSGKRGVVRQYLAFTF